jgi:hypothetical protein
MTWPFSSYFESWSPSEEIIIVVDVFMYKLYGEKFLVQENPSNK